MKVVPLSLKSGLHRLNDTSRKQTTGRTGAGVDAREGTGAEATGIATSPSTALPTKRRLPVHGLISALIHKQQAHKLELRKLT